jgi:hypothetical protein
MEPDAEDKLQLQFLNTPEMEEWAEFQDKAQAAIDAGDATVEVSTSFLALVLPEITSSPLKFDALRAVWNRTCDEQGLPQLKRENTETTEEDAEDGPF